MSYKRILTIQDVSCVGQCSLTVALPILSASGNETCILPSAVLSTHTGGFNGWTFRDLTDDFLKIKEHWIKENIDFDAFYTGYLGSVHQIDLVSSLINSPLKKDDSLIVVDPAMGDYGKLYAGFDSVYVERMKKLVFSADIIIPNFTEACMLTGNEYKEIHNEKDISEISSQLISNGAKTVVITGVSYEKGTLGVFISDGKQEFYDYSVDATATSKRNNGEKFYPVIETMHYEEKLKNYPINTCVLITDPDHDRLTVTQKESADKIPFLKKWGIDFVQLDKDTILSVFSANQAFLMLMNFHSSQLKRENLWKNHPRFMIKTTASAKSWDEWAKNNNVNVVNVPVGFKEIANIMKKVELKIETSPDEDVIVDDVLGSSINLGVNPRLIFGGEESGGMIMGCEDLILSKAGRKAVAMREKSATEAVVVASALIAHLEKEGLSLSEYLAKVFEENNIISKFDTRVDIAYYNESEPDIEKMKADKIKGEEKRTMNDLFYLTMAIAQREGRMTIADVRRVLTDTFPELDFKNLISIKFVGDGTYLDFSDKYIEIRPSGTDAKTKAYGGGNSKDDIEKFASILGNYSGERTALHKNFVDDKFYSEAKDRAMDYYLKFVEKDSNNIPFVIPDYTKTLGIRF